MSYLEDQFYHQTNDRLDQVEASIVKLSDQLDGLFKILEGLKGEHQNHRHTQYDPFEYNMSHTQPAVTSTSMTVDKWGEMPNQYDYKYFRRMWDVYPIPSEYHRFVSYIESIMKEILTEDGIGKWFNEPCITMPNRDKVMTPIEAIKLGFGKYVIEKAESYFDPPVYT